MYLANCARTYFRHFTFRHQTLLSMKLLVILTIIFSLRSAAGGYAQTVSLSLKDVTLEKAFIEIKKQTGFRFVYTREELRSAHNITINAKKISLVEALKLCFNEQPLTYRIEGRYVVIRQKPEEIKHPIFIQPLVDIRGRIINEKGEVINGVTIAVKGSTQATASNEKGEFILTGINSTDILLISSVGYHSQEIAVKGRDFIDITLQMAIGSLDETVVIAYGKSTRRLNTGNISKVSGAEINRQPVSNPLAALSGRVAGVEITQSSGLPGSAINVLIRGRNSLRQGTQPLFIVDGAPFMLATGVSLTTITSVITQSPFNSINPADIESIEVLKDADATAIYGSQGANGVILITTKTGKKGKLQSSVNYATGFGKVTRLPNLLNTRQYLSMRKEAFANDGLIPTISTAPDLLSWDSTDYTDWRKYLLGGTGRVHNLQANLSGGADAIQYYLSGNYYSETTVFPQSQPNDRISARLQVAHQSPGKKFRMSIVTNYSSDKKRLPNTDLTTFIFLPPNAPSPLGNNDSLIWTTGLDNPLSYLHRLYSSTTTNFLNNLNLSYQPLRTIEIRLNAGYHTMELTEQSVTPIKSQRPSIASPPTATNRIATAHLQSFIAEPIAEYRYNKKKSTLTVLGGLSFQHRIQVKNDMTASLYTDDDLLQLLASAPRITVSNRESVYKYAAIFGRINFNNSNKYLLNVNLRRDGSSRFGPANRFSNFATMGAAWVASEEKFIREKISWLSYLKFRSSYGVTGNDQITDYLYLDLWSASSSYQYQGQTGVLQQRLFNPYLQWERNRKFEIAFELGLMNNKIMLQASYYRHRSDNQLIPVTLATQTGFFSITRNLPALIQNAGLEIELSAQSAVTKKLKWFSTINLTIPRNKLLKYPDLERSGDRLIYSIGEPLNVQKKYLFTGLDPATGVYRFSDLDNDGLLSPLADYTKTGVSGIVYYGGISNQLTYKSLQLDIFFQFQNQKGTNYITGLPTTPGLISASGGNQPLLVLDRWTKPGDIRGGQRFTASSSSAAYRAYQTARSSSLALTNASFVRLKNISCYFTLPPGIKKTIESKLFITAQNLFTFTSYKGADPENQSLQSLPPVRMITTGIQINF
jgi:TonB-linked SusC/RagA family outer membrane protein